MRLDLLVRNARIRTMDAERPTASALGVLHGTVVGLDDDVADLDACDRVDLGGRTLLPGFVDAHNHLAWTGLAARSLDLAGAVTIDEVRSRVERAAAEGTGWLDAVNYDQRPLGRHLTRHDIDPVTHGRPFVATHTSGHGQLVNSVVLDAMPDPHGPGVVTDADGRPTGLFLEEATAHVAAIRTPHALSELTDAIAVAAAECAAQGITFVAEAGIGGGLVARSPIEFRAWQDALDTDRLPIRAQIMVSADRIAPVDAHADDGVSHAFPIGLRTGLGGDRLSIGAVKAWLDGGMMARTAALTEPYAGTDDRGDLAPLDGLRERLIGAHTSGWQLALHAIGDRAVDAALDIVQAAQQAHPRPDARHRIEHCGLARPDQLARMAELGVTAVIQPTFLHAFGDDYATIMGPERAPWLYRARSFLDAGVPLAGSSDRPVADGAPLRGIQFLLERTSRGGSVIGPDETVDLDAALAAYTTGAARACRMEHRVGRLVSGMLADLVVLDADPGDVLAAEVADIPVVCTAVGGRLVHGRWPA